MKVNRPLNGGDEKEEEQILPLFRSKSVFNKLYSSWGWLGCKGYEVCVKGIESILSLCTVLDLIL